MRRGRRKRLGRNGDPLILRSAELVGWAIGGLEREIAETRERLDRLVEQAKRLKARLTPAQRQRFSFGRRRTMSAEARRRISEMMKKRWAERKRKA